MKGSLSKKRGFHLKSKLFLFVKAAGYFMPYFFDQTLRLLLISLFVLCGYYLMVAPIQRNTVVPLLTL